MRIEFGYDTRGNRIYRRLATNTDGNVRNAEAPENDGSPLYDSYYEKYGSNDGIQSDGFTSIKIYPNPTNGKTFVKIRGDREHNYTLNVMTITGVRLLQQKVSVGENELNLSNYSNGSYMISVNADNNSFIFKIIKR